jgi:long-chain acyl-CoA synthetase
MVAVPLLVEKMVDRIEARLLSHAVTRMLYRGGVTAPLRGAVRRGLGGRLRAIVVGGAAASPRVLRALERLGVPTLEGYGLTETAPVLTLNPMARPKIGTVGKPLPGVRIRIADANAEGVGEIEAAGPNVMRGYHNDAKSNAEVFDGEWFRTGDLGRLDADGYLTVTGRKKSLIVNREGKNIHPEEVETSINASRFVLESLVLGYAEPGTDGEKVGAIVVPNPEALDKVRRDRGDALGDEAVEALLRDEVKRATAELPAYKRPRRIHIRMEEFEKTSTGKVKRYLYAMAPTAV